MTERVIATIKPPRVRYEPRCRECSGGEHERGSKVLLPIMYASAFVARQTARAHANDTGHLVDLVEHTSGGKRAR